MNKQISEHDEMINETREVQVAENCIPTIDTPETAGAQVSTHSIFREKISIIIAATVAIVAIAVVLLIPTKFERVKEKSCYKAWWSTEADDYFVIDTNPNEAEFARDYKNMDAGVKSLVIAQGQESALEAIRYANEELGFDYVYSQMMETNSLMGRQSAENDKYKVSWTYHPDEGLEVRYERNK